MLTKNIDRKRVLLLATGAAALPLLYSPFTLADPYHLPKEILLSLIACAALLSFPKPFDRSKPLALASILLLACIAVSIPGSTNYHAGLVELKRWAYLLVIFLTAANINWNLARLKTLLYISTAAAVIAAFFITLEYFKIAAPFSYPPSGLYIRSFFSNQNIAAQYLMTAFLWALGLTLASSDTKTRVLNLVCTSISGTALLLTLSRGALAPTLLCSAYLFFLYKKEKGEKLLPFSALRLAIIVMLSLSVIAGALFLSNELSDGRTGRMIGIKIEKKESGRLTRWSDSVNMIRSSPVSGVGLGNYVTEYPRFKTGKWPVLTVYAHNEYLHMATETGAVGILGFMVFTIVTINEIRRRLSNIIEPEENLLRLGILSGCIATLLHSTVSYNLHSATSSYLFFLGLGILCSNRPPEETEPSSRNILTGNLIVFIMVLAALSGIYGEYNRIMGHYHYSEAILSIKRSKSSGSIEYLTKALRYQPHNFRYHAMLSNAYSQTGETDLAEGHFQKARELIPYHFSSNPEK